MADQMQTIKRRMKSVSSTERITNAMKLVSAAKLKQASNRFAYTQNNLDHLARLFKTLLLKKEKESEIYREERPGKTLYLILSGSKGLCGSYNANIINMTESCFRDNGSEAEGIAIGTKILEHCIRQGLNMRKLEEAEGISADTVTYETAAGISSQILALYRQGEIAKINIIYTRYINSLNSQVEVKEVFPLKEADEQEEPPAFLEMDSCKAQLYDQLAGEYLTMTLYNAVSESMLCEHSARRMAMKNASDNAKEMLTELSIYYNRARQTAITNEIIEIIAGAEAQK